MVKQSGTCVIAVIVALAAVHPVVADTALAPYVVAEYGITKPLTAEPGDAERGKALIVDREAGNCLGCHAVPMDAEFFGTTGPGLAGVGARRSAAELRLRLVDPKQINPATIMPSYYRISGLNRVLEGYVGKPVLTAQQVEDIVAYLVSLK